MEPWVCKASQPSTPRGIPKRVPVPALTLLQQSCQHQQPTRTQQDKGKAIYHLLMRHRGQLSACSGSGDNGGWMLSKSGALPALQSSSPMVWPSVTAPGLTQDLGDSRTGSTALPPTGCGAEHHQRSCCELPGAAVSCQDLPRAPGQPALLSSAPGSKPTACAREQLWLPTALGPSDVPKPLQ